MEESLSDKVSCPICFEVPRKEIYQCKNGHSICGGCCERASICTSCRIPFETVKVRNRALEELLDTLKFDCTNREHGCMAKVSRADLNAHAQSCKFSVESIKLCELLGSPCPMQMNVNNSKHTFEHLVSAHSVPVFQGTIGRVRIADVDINASWKTKTVILTNNRVTGLLFVISRNLSPEKLAIICLRIGDESSAEKIGVKLTVCSDTHEKKLPTLLSVVQPFHLKHIKFALENPLFQVPLTYATEGMLSIHYDVLRKNKAGGYEHG